MEELYPRLNHSPCWRVSTILVLTSMPKSRSSGDLPRSAGKTLFRAGTAGWNGIGFVIQAYQKRCPLVLIT